jgi:hypothetical protein
MRRRALVVVLASLLLLAGVHLSTASAAVNDDFAAVTSDGCGVVNFIDYGPGAPGGGNNDDYLVIHDYCADGHGVRVWATQDDGGTVFSRYNGNGLAGAPVVWDPFLNGNVKAGQSVWLEVCLVDGPAYQTPSRCGDASHRSADG